MIYRDRAYQLRDIPRIKEAFHAHRRVLYVGCCGSGKTVVFGKIAQGAQRKGTNVLEMAHRKELIQQASNKLTDFGIEHGIIKAGIDPHYERNIQVGSVQTIIGKLDDLKPPHLIIADEAHHSQNVTQQTIIKAYPDALLLGVTASPVFGTGRSMGGYYDVIVQGPTVRELVDEGYLVDTIVFAPPPEADLEGADYTNIEDLEMRMNKRKVTGSAIEHYQRVAHGMSAIVTCTTVKHADDVAQQFRDAGYTFYAIHGKLHPTVRDKLLLDFNEGRIQGLTQCDIVGEGVDVPRARVMIKLAPSMSLGKDIQNNGRVNRPFYHPLMPQDTADQRKASIAASEKPYSIVLDHVANYFFHGMPDDIYQWSLTEAPINMRQGDPLIPIQQCPSCWLHHKPATVCPYCGAAREIKQRKLIHTKGQLIQIKKDAAATLIKMKSDAKAQKAEAKALDEKIDAQKRQERKACKTYEQLVAHGIKWGYENPQAWAGVQMKFKQHYRDKFKRR